MNIQFDTEELRNECNNQELLAKSYGATRARLIRQRLDEMFNAGVLEDLRSMPHVRFAEPPHGADLALDLGAPYQLIFRPTGGSSIGIGEWKKIDSVIIRGFRKHHAKPKP
ncbi:MAG: killer suppression protein [Fibrobacteria bacterium]